MKLILKFVTGAALLGLILPGAILAQTAKKPVGAYNIATARAKAVVSPLAKYDTNQNGALDDAELAVLKADYAAKRAEWLKPYDTNNNGKIDPAEAQAIKAAFVSGPSQKPKTK